VATRLLRAVEVGGGIRLLGVGISGLADAVQGELFEARPGERSTAALPEAVGARPEAWVPGSDVTHTRWGLGWVEAQEGAELRVRFETEVTDPGPLRRLRTDDPDLCLVGTG
ncbi:MAG: DNA polymerase IV, partial [Candidatus Dormibacteraeota bacterium]|nr:DNA polymerase IV [Candidatus Dormibacteraeota bacterium]